MGFFFLPADISDGPAQAAVGLIILQLYGRAPYGKTSPCLFFVCRCEAGGVLGQPLGFHCELFMVRLNGALMKNGDHFRPHCSGEILPLGATFI